MSTNAKLADELKDDRLCPSSKASAGALLIGVVGSNGKVGMLGRPLPVDADFLSKAGKGRALEKRFRFSSPCVKSSCKQWKSGRCGVIDKVVAIASPDEITTRQPCAIRSTCRWFSQSGFDACSVCPEVVTDTR